MRIATKNFGRTLSLIALASAAAGTMAHLSLAHAGEVPGSELFGHWKLTKALDSADIASLDDHEAKQLIGRVFVFNKEHVRFGKRECGAPELEAKSVEPVWYLREKAHASAELLHLPNPVTVVSLACTTAFVRNPQHIVLFWKGWFFDAKRVR